MCPAEAARADVDRGQLVDGIDVEAWIRPLSTGSLRSVVSKVLPQIGLA